MNSDDSTLDDLISLWEQERARGHELSPADLCPERPELAPELGRRISALRQMDGLREADTPALPTRVADSESQGAPAGWLASLPGYDVVGELGRGGMGVVYKAVHRVLGRTVALKMISVGGGAQTERFRVEAEAAARLQHPNIVPIYDVGEWQGSPFFSLELMDSGTLADWLRGARPGPAEAAGLVAVLARAMHHAHERGVVHRDLKPANILLSSAGRAPGGPHPAAPGGRRLTDLTAKVGDFGLAKLLAAGEPERTRSGAVLGTPSYMAPEQAAGRTREVGPPADIYALGAVLYELLAGCPVFRGESVLETAQKVLNEEPVPPSRLQPHVPRDLETICLKCLEKEPARRYATALDLADDLERFGEGRPIRARPVPPWERLLKWVRRRPAVAALVAVSGLALLGALGVLLARVEASRARQAEAKAHESQMQEQVAGAEAAAAQGDWQGARLRLDVVLKQIGSDPLLTALKDKAESLRTVAERQLEERDGRRAARARYERFLQRRHDALFHRTLYTGRDDLAADLKETKKAAEEALDLFQASAEGGPDLGPYYSEAESAAILRGCYELLLILSEVAAQPAPGQPAEEARPRAREALRLLERAAPLGPPTRAYHRRRAQYLERLGDGPAAADERRTAEAIQPDSALDQFLAGEEGYRQGLLGEQRHREDLLGEAARHFEQTLRLQPDHFWARYFLALCYLRGNRPAEALVPLTDCLIARPEFPWLYLLRGFALGQLRGSDQTNLDNALAAAEKDFERVLGLLKGSPDEAALYTLYTDRGVTRYQHGKIEVAAADFRRAIELSPGRYQARLSLGMVYQRQGKLDQALEQVNAAIAAEPSWAEPYRCRARIRAERGDAKRGDQDAALRDFEQAAHAQRRGTALDQARDHSERAHYLLLWKHYQEAVAACDAALMIGPESPGGVYEIRSQALLRLAAGEPDPARARAYCEEVVRSLDRYLKTGKPSVVLYKARAAAREKLEQRLAAVEDYTLALQLAPSPRLYAARGWAYLLAKVPARAVEDFNVAIALAPDDANALSGRGYARVLLGQYQVAVEDAEKAVRLPGPTWQIYHRAACTLAQAVRWAEADPSLTAAKAREARDTHERRAVELLQKALDARTTEEQRRAFWHDYVAEEPALRPISHSEGFIRLKARYAPGDR